ncbi:HEAT repeat domain-containing protein [Luteolibacter sp. GHJ8]|uniref:HEAT repeat domain-containing protein n=1 Tax=Luteolibacter rhizosphaerae TaxID=2989719 RepID=A0ABT3G7A4_9BACT|nr:PVC-type heme-binding CxxCH protein [Luteolibacter rhizosphaerae]MCW1915733.1 HEAT repeat domain-containing protein [Luteolibacter rhizosphaerae]
MHRSVLLLGLLPLSALHAEAAFELRDGDRVAFLGDAFAEREQYEGWIEMAATTRFPDRAVTFRNLGWSADTPAGDSRCGLSLLQAGHEPAGEGWRQLQNQLTTYKPTLLITGYGMASSLAGGQTPEEFRRDFTRLLDHAATLPGLRVWVSGAPPRFLREGETDATPEVRQHRESLAAINAVMKEIADQRRLPFVSLDGLAAKKGLSDNGIHLTSAGYQAAAREIEQQLGWPAGKWDKGDNAAALRRAILRKNEWFFHRSRPANMAYIFGFRKAEQGRNAGEIDAFDKLVEEEEKRIAQMRGLTKSLPDPQRRTESAVAANTKQPHPKFTVADDYEVTLWAENPLMHKPTQMNFDEHGRLWVASSETYPQVEVGQTADDKVLILEDKNGDGKAETSTVFAEGMLMPTAILPGDGGCYVGQSTDLLHFKDTNGDGKADTRTRVLSGFGTEDTHHNLHTLRRGPDGKLWMNQSIYTRTDTETPNGLMRLKSGGIMKFDPRADKIETVFYGWCNAWGHQFDKYGQSFVTDGAGGGGINWAVPGAMYFTYAGAEKTLDSISPGSYPKFCGLEIIESPNFPAEWQGNMITCDFRAQRVVRFSVTESGSGYAAQEVGDLLRSTDVNFRPIDVKIGPDGALYIADWSNPIINHGEVDFRDPRRDREHGRIWRVQKKGATLTPKRDLAKLPDAELLGLLTSDHRHEREQAMVVLTSRSKDAAFVKTAEAWAASAKDSRAKLAALWLTQGMDRSDFDLLGRTMQDDDPKVRAAAVRVAGSWLDEMGKAKAGALLTAAAQDAHPRVRLEAVRVLSKIEDVRAMDAALKALDQPTDRFLDYALWLNVRSEGNAWINALLGSKLPLEGRDNALAFVLANLPKGAGIEGVRKLMPQTLPRDGSGPWIGLALKTKDPHLTTPVYSQALQGGFEPAVTAKILSAMVRDFPDVGALPAAADALRKLFNHSDPELASAALRLAGAAKNQALQADLVAVASGSSAPARLRIAALEGLSYDSSGSARDVLLGVVKSDASVDIKGSAALALARSHRGDAIAAIREVIPGLSDNAVARAFWQQALSISGLSGELAKSFASQPLAAEVAALNLPAVPDIDEHAPLVKALREQAGAAAMSGPSADSVQRIAKLAAEKGDAARGEMIYRQPALACAACHAIGGAGGKVGPDMTSIGASAPIDYLVESVLLPGAKVKEGYHSVIFETKDGRTIIGRLLRSGGGSLVVSDAAGTETTLSEDAILKKTDTGSLMPAGLINSLGEQEQADLFKFISQLGKPGPYDATKSRAPRVWAVMPVNGEPSQAVMAGDAAQPWVSITGTVNGTLLASDVSAMTGAANEVLAATKLELSAPAEVSFSFPADAKPTGFWVDGKPVEGGKVSLAAGAHRIVLRAPLAAGKVRFEASAGTFLPTW